MPLTLAEPISMLLVEDSPVDAKLTQVAIAGSNCSVSMHHVDDGLSALALLRGEEREKRFIPDVILLDLGLPRMRGIEVIEHLGADSDLADIPIIVLTGSAARDDVLLEARQHDQVVWYLRKPLDVHVLERALQRIENRVRLNRLRSLTENGRDTGSGT